MNTIWLFPVEGCGVINIFRNLYISDETKHKLLSNYPWLNKERCRRDELRPNYEFPTEEEVRVCINTLQMV